ncbi:MAG TPA: HAMP domain-containing sensor histidine kinase [Longimicrobium sp.]|nr:HAMP domain-containing sensor histidine kinase [Longimicrobium sp.]
MTLQAAPLSAPDEVMVAVSVIVVVSVVIFTTAVVVAMLRRSDRRRVEEEKLAALGTATARILHQIKNPLQTIVLHADILQDERIVNGPDQRREVCETIVGESQRMVQMFEELSLWTSGSKRTLNRRPLRLDEMVRQVAEVEAREGAGTGVMVEAADLSEATVYADAYYLRQVFENLVRNAREAMHGQEQPSWIRVSVGRRSGKAEVRVTDNGPGIPPEMLQTIFEPFISSKGKGMGLGLAICRDFVEAHDGRIEVESTVGRGTTFTVLLPFYNEVPALVGAA